jgi:hypothetical protein
VQTAIIVTSIIRRCCMGEGRIVFGGIQTWECRASECEVVFSNNKLLSVDAGKDVDDVARVGAVVCFCELEHCKYIIGSNIWTKGAHCRV